MMKWFNKYLSVFKTSFKQEKDTTLNIVFRAVSFLIMIYIFFQLWNYIYGQNGTSQIIKGYSLEQMIWYLIITELLYYTCRYGLIVKEISDEIKNGNIAYKLNKPYNYYLYQITSFMAKSCFSLIFLLLIAVIMEFGFVGIVPSFTWAQIFPCLLSVLLSTFLSWTIYSIIGLISFWIQDSTPFTWIFSKFVMLLGLFFPVEFFPNWLQPFIKYSPIYSIMSGPASLVANFSWKLFAQVAISQTVWAFVFILVGIGIYNLGKRRVTANGG